MGCKVLEDSADNNSAKKSDDIVVLIPAFNESLVIGSVVLQARKYASRVIVVDDGSADNTSEVAELAGAEVITMPQNVGKASAMMAGFARARELNVKATVMMDGDGQHFASDIPVVAAPVLSGEADMVVGSRFLETGTGEEEIPAYRRIGQKVLNEATNLSSDVKCSDSQSGFRALSRKALESMDFPSSGYGIESDMLSHFSARDLKISEAPISVTYEVPHKHKMNPIKHGLSVLSGILQLFTIKRPILCFGVPGFAIGVIGFVLAVISLDTAFRTGIWSATMTLMSAILIMMGMLLCSVALILFSISKLVTAR